MIKTYVKPIADWKRKYAFLPKLRIGAQIKDPTTKKVVGIEVTKIWLSSYWRKLTINQNRQVTEVILTDEEYFTQEYLPKLKQLIYIRIQDEPEFGEKVIEKAFALSTLGKTPEEFYMYLYKETPEKYWKTAFAKALSATGFVTSRSPYTVEQITTAAYNYYIIDKPFTDAANSAPFPLSLYFTTGIAKGLLKLKETSSDEAGLVTTWSILPKGVN